MLVTIGASAGVIKAITVVVGGMFIYTLVANISSWNFGVNSVIAYAAEDGTFPKSWAKRNKNGVPYVVSIWTGIVGAIIAVGGIIVGQFFPEAADLFWTFFSLSLVTLLLSYLPMFMAFLKLHKKGPATKKGYWISGGKIKVTLFGIIPFLLILIALFFTLFPEFNLEMFSYNWPLITGAAIAIIIGEIMVWNMSRKQTKTSKTKRVRARSTR